MSRYGNFKIIPDSKSNKNSQIYNFFFSWPYDISRGPIWNTKHSQRVNVQDN